MAFFPILQQCNCVGCASARHSVTYSAVASKVLREKPSKVGALEVVFTDFD
jgi:hypothetical protein